MTKNVIYECISTREKYIELVKQELMGPGSEFSLPDAEHEIITDPPDKRYSVGILFPKESKMNADNDESRISGDESTEVIDSEVDVDDVSKDTGREFEKKEKFDYEDGEEENLDEEIALSTQNKPSSFGITFFVDRDVKKIECDVEFAMYRKTTLKDCKVLPLADKTNLRHVPVELSSYIYFDESDGYLKPEKEFQYKDIEDIIPKKELKEDDKLFWGSIYDLLRQINSGYIRIPYHSHEIIDFSNDIYVDCNKNICGASVKITAIKRAIHDGMYSVTIMMVNDVVNDLGNSVEKVYGSRCILQPRITIKSKENSLKFVDYAYHIDFAKMTTEEQSLALQYRNKKKYAAGLGTSTIWSVDNSGEGYVATEFFPEIEIPQTDFGIPEGVGISSDLSMRYFSDLDDSNKNEKIAKLEEVVNAYLSWIGKLEEQKKDLSDGFRDIATKNIENCRLVQKRMVEGIDHLRNNSYAWNAFLLANRAMFMQRVHMKIQNLPSETDKYPGDEKLKKLMESINYRDISELTLGHRWRLFQIAFILMSISSIVDDKSFDREIADLIWFPTGGGKTEAYLGLIAFTIFYRRLAYLDHSGGTAVIMRYTLRLLTSQQFTRASTLICACECIRKDSGSDRPRYGAYLLGDEPITIGLWIGSEHVPNDNASANKYLKKLEKACKTDLRVVLAKNNKFQVLKCPWCGTKMIKGIGSSKNLVGQFGYRVNKGHFSMFCPQDGCDFESELPVQIIDEELYKNPPTLLFGTVDKFAMMPWNERIENFFGGDGVKGNRAPELIIQDELHLISGPLGTMVGLYETALESLCRKHGILPKIVASTATIRRAKEQCNALYDREVCQFPPPGLDSDDSFFSKDLKVDHGEGEYGRKYIGLMPSGTSKARMEVKAMAALLEKLNLLSLDDTVKDKFWTLTVYFNSLKDLSKCSNLVRDDIPVAIRNIAKRSNIPQRFVFGADELTSRVSTTLLNDTLEKLEKVGYSEENLELKHYPSSIVLATNMISVGIDISRLNVMLMIGQPKLTSEYIQASSRIGRSFPGVAFVMYDATKSRDRSHYEQFKSYHESFYRYVEPTGVTPFSKPARERALHAILVTMMRAFEPLLKEESSAKKFSRTKFDESISHIKKIVVDRVNHVAQILNVDMKFNMEELEKEMDNIFERWEMLAAESGYDEFDYGKKYMVRHPEKGAGRLLKQFGTVGDNAFETMTSMRNVDVSVCGNVLIWEDDK